MPENLKPILSTLVKIEYRNEGSLQRLAFINCQTQFAVLNAIRNHSGGEEGAPSANHKGLLKEFAQNRNALLKAGTSRTEDQKDIFDQIQKNLTHLISSFIQKAEKRLFRKMEKCICE